MTKIVQFNVSGTHYDVAADTLLRFSDTMLAKMVSEEWNKGSNKEPLFIDRDGERFRYILDWYRDGRITVPKTVAINAVKSDALFYGLPENAIIEETHSIGDYVISLYEANLRLKNMRSSLQEISVKNSVEGFAIWVILQMLDNLTLACIFPTNIRMSSVDYRKINPAFALNSSYGDILLAAIQKIFATQGDDLLPASLSINFIASGNLIACTHDLAGNRVDVYSEFVIYFKFVELSDSV